MTEQALKIKIAFLRYKLSLYNKQIQELKKQEKQLIKDLEEAEYEYDYRRACQLDKLNSNKNKSLETKN